MTDAAVKRSGLIEVEARQLIDELDRSEAAQFAEAVTAKVPSPLTPGFWQPVAAALPRDLRRIGLFLDQGRDRIARAARGGVPWPALLGTLLGILLLYPGRALAGRLGQRHLIAGAPGHRVRRSAFAIWRVLTGTLSPLLAAAAFVQGLRWSGLMPDRWGELLDTLVAAAGFGGFTVAVTGAMLMRSQPSWRVAPIDDETATRLKPLSWLLAALTVSSLVLRGFNATVGASHAASVASEALVALLYLLLIAAFLLALGRIRSARADRDDGDSAQTRAGLGLVELLVWFAVAVAAVALLLGYVGLGYTIVQFVGWATVLGCATYLATCAADDLLTSLLTRRSRLGQMLTRGLGLRGSAIDQVGLILSGVLRAVLIVVACGLLLSPFGAGGGLATLFGRLGTLASGIEVGGVAISPGTILRGMVVLFVGLALLRAFLRWLENRYLPATDLDDSGRNSVSLVARYLGIVLATVWALSALGIGMERMALLLSALSVGIGFGLQAITQNFISGLILLAERPIKIGDLVRVGTDEGDVKRISVRATEIELPDHSTLIVPNSELITKTVLNKTLSSPLGRVQIQFSVPIEADADAVQAILLDCYRGDDAILDDPAPVIFIDSIADGRILFNSFAHVAGPRAAYRARSAVYVALLRRLRAAGIDIGTVPQKLELATALPPPAEPPR